MARRSNPISRPGSRRESEIASRTGTMPESRQARSRRRVMSLKEMGSASSRAGPERRDPDHRGTSRGKRNLAERSQIPRGLNLFSVNRFHGQPACYCGRSKPILAATAMPPHQANEACHGIGLQGCSPAPRHKCFRQNKATGGGDMAEGCTRFARSSRPNPHL